MDIMTLRLHRLEDENLLAQQDKSESKMEAFSLVSAKERDEIFRFINNYC